MIKSPFTVRKTQHLLLNSHRRPESQSSCSTDAAECSTITAVIGFTSITSACIWLDFLLCNCSSDNCPPALLCHPPFVDFIGNTNTSDQTEASYSHSHMCEGTHLSAEADRSERSELRLLMVLFSNTVQLLWRTTMEKKRHQFHLKDRELHSEKMRHPRKPPKKEKINSSSTCWSFCIFLLAKVELSLVIYTATAPRLFIARIVDCAEASWNGGRNRCPRRNLETDSEVQRTTVLNPQRLTEKRGFRSRLPSTIIPRSHAQLKQMSSRGRQSTSVVDSH